MTNFYFQGDTMPWSSTDAKIKTALSTLTDPDNPKQVARDSWDWVDNFGRMFLEQHGDRTFLMRDYWPGNAGANAYVLNYNWTPTDKDKAATDWRVYSS